MSVFAAADQLRGDVAFPINDDVGRPREYLVIPANVESFGDDLIIERFGAEEFPQIILFVTGEGDKDHVFSLELLDQLVKTGHFGATRAAADEPKIQDYHFAF